MQTLLSWLVQCRILIHFIHIERSAFQKILHSIEIKKICIPKLIFFLQAILGNVDERWPIFPFESVMNELMECFKIITTYFTYPMPRQSGCHEFPGQYYKKSSVWMWIVTGMDWAMDWALDWPVGQQIVMQTLLSWLVLCRILSLNANTH